MKKTKLTYTGAPKKDDLFRWLESESLRLGGYIVATTIFCEAYAMHCERLPASVYSPSDWPLGYWKNGVRHDWSDARKTKCSNAALDCQD